MWALRSFLRRPNPLISRLRGHDPTHTAVPGRNLIAASRRRFSDATNGDPHQPAAPTKRHLYLVLDDHKEDYGIYKLDADADLDGDVGSGSETDPPPLPNPALIRLDVQYESTQFAAAGSCIVATACLPYRDLAHSDDYGIVTLLYDIKRAALSVSTHPTDTLQGGYAVAVPVGNRLFVLDSCTSTIDSFHVMTTSKDGVDDWGWDYSSGSSRCRWTCGGKARSWSDQLPFDPRDIQAHAVHPRDCTIFVSAPVSYELQLQSGDGWRDDVDTFTYDTTRVGCNWTRCGWGLPFKGHAHYDRQLNQWVGLQVDERGGDGTTGYLSACDIPSNEHKDCPSEEPKRTSSMEKILLDDPEGRLVDFKLVYMGGKYCLVERLGRPGVAEKKRWCLGDGEGLGDGEECVLRLTTFRLKYEYDDPDYLSILDRRARSYKVSRYRDDFEAQAFWI